MSAEVSDGDCPGPGEAFVTTCSGSESHHSGEPSAETETLDDLDLVDEVLEDSKKTSSHAHTNDGSQQDLNSGAPSVKKQFRAAVQRYYDPLPSPGKCAIGTICGFASSRLSLGMANRAFRFAGATWVLSEVMETSGFCDEARCVSEEAQPWIELLRKALIKQCIRVRLIARRMWNRDRIREIAQKDGMVTGGFAAGAFIGFIV